MIEASFIRAVFGTLAVALLSVAAVFAQMRYEKLVVDRGKVFSYDIQSDILVADTLILKDSAVIQLNPLRSENIIRAKVIRVEGRAFIIGNGQNGQQGRNGRPGTSGQGPCRDGGPGLQAQNGLAGVNGTNLVMYCDNLIINKQLVINLIGGNGGNGGNGGAGGEGSQGTVHCNGGNGGNGGDGGRGGDGGQGGNFIFQGPHALSVKEELGKKLIIANDGGQPGRGGMGGLGGPAGLGPNRKNGKYGLAGAEGAMGTRGKPGTITFRTN
ncbi:MAG: hypothetical protein N2044_01270 [Cyclobacteriaceae bacterium]|nr:hypothetical protein [Cyclobacteriaceae bacterium]